MEFQKLTLEDIGAVRPFFGLVCSNTCDFTTGGMFMWRHYYDMEYLIEDNTLFSRLKNELGEVYYNLPLSENIPAAIAACVSRMQEKGGIKFCTVPEYYLKYFTALCPDAVITEQTDYSDYLYNASDLTELSGSKYHAARNQISQFKRNYPEWAFEDFHSIEAGAVTEFFSALCRETQADGATADAENKMVPEVLRNMDKYGMIGGVLTVSGKIAGFSLGELINGTLFIHIEKADRNYKGVYQMLSNQFAERFGKEAKFINREEDMGDPGLRRAKNAYHPISLLKKYIVEVS